VRKKEIPPEVYFSVVAHLERHTGRKLSPEQPRLIEVGDGAWMSENISPDVAAMLGGLVVPFTAMVHRLQPPVK
jgi:hypothetical protein